MFAMASMLAVTAVLVIASGFWLATWWRRQFYGTTLYTRTAENEIKSQFHRLPDPDLVMYVFPHLAGSEPVPVPGYSTVFPFYRQLQYALPGERVEDY